MTMASKRVLLVEDNRADAVLLQNMLLQVPSASFDLIWADRLQKALDRLGQESFDVILLDLALPDSDGLATLERVKAVSKATPIVIMTGLADEQLGMQAIRQGAQDYLVKGSLNGRAVARAIHYAIDRRRAEEELRQAQMREMAATAAAATAQVAHDTIKAMTEGVALLDLAGRIVSINPAMEQLSGFATDAVRDRPLAELLPSLLAGDELSAAEAALRELQSGRLPVLTPFTLRARGQEIPVVPSTAFVDGPDGRPSSIVLTLRDIAEVKRAQQAMEISEKKYRELVENANSVIMRRKPDGTITFFNEYAQTFFGYREDEILGRNVLGTIVPEVDSAGNRLDTLIREIGRHPEAHTNNENENQCRDGRRVWMQWTNRALRNEYGDVDEVLCVGIDATQRRDAEERNFRYQEQLRSLAARLASTEEEERWRVSRQIHDTVIQSLSLSNIKLGAAARAAEDAGLSAEQMKLGIVRELIVEAIAQCRLLMSDLTPPLLYELGLKAALEHLVAKLQRQHDVRIELEDDGASQSLDNALRGLLFQATRELVVNALKHANASEVTITTRSDGSLIRVCVRDNGTGIDPSKTEPRGAGQEGGFGLFSIRERVEGLGGHLHIQSSPGKGTTITIAAPFTLRDDTADEE